MHIVLVYYNLLHVQELYIIYIHLLWFIYLIDLTTSPNMLWIFSLFVGNTDAYIKLQPALRFNGGGHINHSIFWEVMSPNGGGEPSGQLMEAIKRDFGSFESMKKELGTASTTVQGSGWGWLGYNPATRRLRVATCANQDPLQPTTGMMIFSQCLPKDLFESFLQVYIVVLSKIYMHFLQEISLTFTFIFICV